MIKKIAFTQISNSAKSFVDAGLMDRATFKEIMRVLITGHATQDKHTFDDSKLSKKMIARKYNVCERTVHRWMKEGLITPIKVGRRSIRFNRDEVEQAIEKL